MVYKGEKRNLRSLRSSPCRLRSGRPAAGWGRLLAVAGWTVPRQLIFAETSDPGPRNGAAAIRKPTAMAGVTPHLPLRARMLGAPSRTCAARDDLRPRACQGDAGSEERPRQSAPTWPRAPAALSRPARLPLPQPEPPARNLTSRRRLRFRRHRRSHPAGSAAPGAAAWRAPGQR